MIHFLLVHWVAVCIVGIGLNFWAVVDASGNEPEGAMGAIMALPFCFVPYLILILGLVGIVIDRFSRPGFWR